MDWLVRIGSPGQKIFQKVVLDLLFSPFFAVTFVTTVALIEGHSVLEAVNEYCSRFWEYFKVDCCIWPPVQTINFAFVSQRFRTLYVQAAILLYSTCITYIRHKKEVSAAKEIKE